MRNQLRSAFERCILDRLTSIDVGEDQPMPLVEIRRRLRRCNDIMPTTLCHALGLRPGATYATGVRWPKTEGRQRPLA